MYNHLYGYGSVSSSRAWTQTKYVAEYKVKSGGKLKLEQARLG